MTRIVLDENVVRNAWHSKKPDGSDAFSDVRVMTDVLLGDYDVQGSEKIRSKLSAFRKKTQHITKDVNDLLLNKYMQLVYDSSRFSMHKSIKTDFKGVKDCDNEFVGVTLTCKAVLVTADEKLKIAIKADKKVSHCECKTTEEIIEDEKKKN